MGTNHMQRLVETWKHVFAFTVIVEGKYRAGVSSVRQRDLADDRCTHGNMSHGSVLSQSSRTSPS